MRGVQNIYHHVCAFSFLLLFFFLVLVLSRPAFSTHVNTFSSTDSLTISSNRTIVSPGDVFELGFFKLASSSRWYLGTWYKNIPDRTYVWVANRDKPLSNSIGTFKISDTNLVLLDQSQNIVWSTNLMTGRRNVKSPMVAELLDNGNFVLRYSRNNNNTSGFLWQSFDFPTDTLLPQMKLGLDLKTGSNRFLRSWRSPDDPASGEYSYKLETRGLPEFFLLVKDFTLYRTGPWNGIRFNGVPEMPQLVNNVTENKEEITYTFLVTNDSIYSKLTIAPSGNFQQLTWDPEALSWNLLWSLPNDQCDLYVVCGAYGYCDDATTPMCNCIKGFKPMDMHAWASGDTSHGCARNTALSCGGGDGFLRLTNMKLPDTTTATVDKRIGIMECKKRCVGNCNCTAFANADIRNGGSGCVIWTGELVDMRSYAEGGQDFYVRLAPADVGY